MLGLFRRRKAGAHGARKMLTEPVSAGKRLCGAMKRQGSDRMGGFVKKYKKFEKAS
jgi:hypothetical protein